MTSDTDSFGVFRCSIVRPCTLGIVGAGGGVLAGGGGGADLRGGSLSFLLLRLSDRPLICNDSAAFSNAAS